jgi:hypothetical protein
VVHRWIYGVLAGALIMALGAGCGGGGDDSSTTITKAQFIKMSKAICMQNQKDRFAEMTAYDKKLKADGKETQDNAALEEKLVAVLIPSMRKKLEDLEALGVPGASQEKVTNLLQSLANGIDNLEKEKLAGLSKATQLLAFEKEAVALGLTCPA